MAVRLFGRLYRARDLLVAGPLRRRWQRRGDLAAWPVVAGDYRRGDTAAGVAVCTLSSRDLIEPVARLPGVAIAVRLITVNLGIEDLVTNLVANPRIRALVEHGVTAEHRIIGARGHWPVLANLSETQIERFREQIAVIEAIGTSDLSLIARGERAAPGLALRAGQTARALTDNAHAPPGELQRSGASQSAGAISANRSGDFHAHT